jgi:predicted O-methyltransferase YrrM
MKEKFEVTEGFMTLPQAEWLEAWLQKHLEVKKVLEIGFNGGFSSGVFLNTRPDITVTSVDLGAHPYVLTTKAWIDHEFPRRHLLLIGDSRDVLPRIPDSIREADMIFIDGGHQGDVPERDIYNVLKHCSPKAWIVIDDYAQYAPDVVRTVNQNLKDHKLHGVQAIEGGQRGWIVCKPLY